MTAQPVGFGINTAKCGGCGATASKARWFPLYDDSTIRCCECGDIIYSNLRFHSSDRPDMTLGEAAQYARNQSQR